MKPLKLCQSTSDCSKCVATRGGAQLAGASPVSSELSMGVFPHDMADLLSKYFRIQ